MKPKEIVEKRHSDLGDFAPPEGEIIGPEEQLAEADDNSDAEDIDNLEDDSTQGPDGMS